MNYESNMIYGDFIGFRSLYALRVYKVKRLKMRKS